MVFSANASCRLHRLSGFELLDMSGPASVFNSANRALVQQGRPAYYKVSLVSAEGGAVESSSGVAVETSSITEIQPGEAQTVLVAGAEREQLLTAVGDPVLRAMLPAMTARADRFGSVCSGGFLLAALGLLDGRRVATHWDSSKPARRDLSGRHRRPGRALRRRRAVVDVGRRDHRHRHGVSHDRQRP
jgi:transcriptional regulator GlxA family with amidase domain